MTISNSQAITIMHEIQQDDHSHIDELKEACYKQLSIVIHSKGYKFFSDWGEDDYRNEVLIRVWMDCNKFDEHRGSFSTWVDMLERTVYNKHIEKSKREVDTTPIFIQGEDEEEINVMDLFFNSKSCEEKVIACDSCQRIYKELYRLPTNQRQAIKLCRIGGYKPSEAARMMNCKSADISRWINRGVNKLEKFVEREELSANDGYSKVA